MQNRHGADRFSLTKNQKFEFATDLSLLDKVDLELSEMWRRLDQISLDSLLRKASLLSSEDTDLYDLRAPLSLALWSYLNPGKHLTLAEISGAVGLPSRLCRTFGRHLNKHVGGYLERIKLEPAPIRRGRPLEGHQDKKPGRRPYGYRGNPIEYYVRLIHGQESLLPLVAYLSRRNCLKELDLIGRFFGLKRAPEYLQWSFTQVSQVLSGLIPFMPDVWKGQFKDISVRLGLIFLPDLLSESMTSFRRNLTSVRSTLLSLSNEEILDAITPDVGKYCSNCNSTLPLKAKSCPVCGAMQN
jgi:hypothetical protein